jgi:hypothetical protein
MKINFDRIICLNLAALNTQQLFAICETYLIGFEELYKRKTETKVSKYWMDDHKIIAYVIDGFFFMSSEFKSVSKEDQDKIKSIKPIKTPKMPKGEQTLLNYKAFLAEGYDIRTPSMDSKLKFLEESAKNVKNVTVKDVVESKIELPVVLEVDAILEKIFKYGINSITAEEKSLLDNQ